ACCMTDAKKPSKSRYRRSMVSGLRNVRPLFRDRQQSSSPPDEPLSNTFGPAAVNRLFSRRGVGHYGAMCNRYANRGSVAEIRRLAGLMDYDLATTPATDNLAP